MSFNSPDFHTNNNKEVPTDDIEVVDYSFRGEGELEPANIEDIKHSPELTSLLARNAVGITE